MKVTAYSLIDETFLEIGDPGPNTFELTDGTVMIPTNATVRLYHRDGETHLQSVTLLGRSVEEDEDSDVYSGRSFYAQDEADGLLPDVAAAAVDVARRSRQ